MLAMDDAILDIMITILCHFPCFRKLQLFTSNLCTNLNDNGKCLHKVIEALDFLSSLLLLPPLHL